MEKIKILFNVINTIFVVLYVYPGSILGFVIYRELHKQPQISPRPIIADPQGLQHVRPSRTAFPTPTILDDDPFSTILVDGTVTVYEEDHGRSSGDAVRFTQVKDIVGARFLLKILLAFL